MDAAASSSYLIGMLLLRWGIALVVLVGSGLTACVTPTQVRPSPATIGETRCGGRPVAAPVGGRSPRDNTDADPDGEGYGHGYDDGLLHDPRCVDGQPSVAPASKP